MSATQPEIKRVTTQKLREMKERNEKNPHGADLARPTRQHRRQNRLLAGRVRRALLCVQGRWRRHYVGVAPGRPATAGP